MATHDKAMRNAMIAINRIAADMGFGGSGPRYRYYEDKKKNRYFYTCEKVNHKEKPRYVAGIYRYRKTKDDWILRKQVGFAKKKTAIAWARKKYERNKSV